MPLNPPVATVDGFGFSLSPGGDFLFPFTAGATGAQTVKPSPGRLGRVVLAAANGAAAIVFYDNPSAASGTVIGVIPASAAAGTYDFQMPARTGITFTGASTNPALTVGYV
jgi:hypothetical protein